MNEWYLRDCSRKITAVLRAKGKEGKPLTNNPPYGYMKDAEDKNCWVIDEEAAAVVRRIFAMTVEGMGPGSQKYCLMKKWKNRLIIRQSGEGDVIKTSAILNILMRGWA